MKAHRLRWLLWLLLLAGCDPNRVYEENTDLPTGYWAEQDIKTFTFRIEDAQAGYNLFLNLRNSLDYPHSNIYIKYVLSDSLHRPVEQELRNFQLFHPKTGYPFGSGSGHVYAHEFDLLMDYHFPAAGTYYLSMTQFMRYDSLPGIRSVGLRVERHAGD